MNKRILVLMTALWLGLAAVAWAQNPPPEPRPEAPQGNPVVGDLKQLWESGTVKTLTVTLGTSVTLVANAPAASVTTDKLPLISVAAGKTNTVIDASPALGYVFNAETGGLQLILP